jgi:hypothetical protein
MAESKKLEIPPALYDYVLFYECAQKDWRDFSKKLKVKGDGSLMDAINWSIDFSLDPNDAGGATKFGVTATTWKGIISSYPNKGYNSDLNSMGKEGWMDVVNWFWNSSHAGSSANYACAFLLFQMKWGGFNNTVQKNLLAALKEKADIKDYPFTTSEGNYKRISDATHAFTEPLEAFAIIRNNLLAFYRNISRPDYVNSAGKSNKGFRVGWFNRVALPFTPYGFYVCTSTSGKSLGLKYESTIEDWDAAISQHVQSGAKGMIKIFDWGATPEAIEKMIANAGSYYDPSSSGGYSSSGFSGGSYAGCSNISQLGNFTTAPDAEIVFQQIQNKEDVLNTLMSGSYTPGEVKKCEELTTSEKKKNAKIKSDN